MIRKVKFFFQNKQAKVLLINAYFTESALYVVQLHLLNSEFPITQLSMRLHVHFVLVRREFCFPPTRVNYLHGVQMAKPVSIESYSK